MYNDDIIGVRDICTGNLISFNEIISKINKSASTNIVPTYLPRPRLYIEGSRGDSSFAKEMLGREFTSVDDGIKAMLNAFKHEDLK